MDSALALSICDLKVRTPRGRTILDLPKLELQKGRSLAVRGASGAGKSTLLRALMGLAPGASGGVRWMGQDILAMAPAQRARFRRAHIGTMFQDFLLFDELTPVENAGIQALFSPAQDRRSLRDMAHRVLSTMDVPVEARSVASFSGGERQRVALARALAHNPEIVLADEPTASLHKAAGDALIDMLLNAVNARGITLVIVSHDEDVTSKMDADLELKHGTTAELAP